LPYLATIWIFSGKFIPQLTKQLLPKVRKLQKYKKKFYDWGKVSEDAVVGFGMPPQQQRILFPVQKFRLFECANKI
jgi:hypothetical protein